MRRNVFSIAVVAAIAVGMAACSSGSSGSGNDSTAPGPDAIKDTKGVTEITIWHGLGAANGEAFTSLINAFNAENTGKVHVTPAYQGVYVDLLAKYTAAIRSDSAPTIMLAGDVATGYMIDVGKSIPAAGMATANPDGLKLADLLPLASNYYKVNNTQWAVPMNMSTPMLWVNRDLLAQAGIPKGARLKTLEEVVQAAKTIHEKTGKLGLTMPDDDWYLEQLTATAGQEFCTPDNGRGGKPAQDITINTGAAKGAITKVAELYRSGVAVSGAPDGSAALSAFQASKVGMMLHSSGILGSLKKGTAFDYEALPFPISGPKGDSGTIIGGSALWLSKMASDAQKVAGWKLETYLTSSEAQETFSHATGYVPINTKTNDSATQKDFLARNPNFQAFVDQVTSVPVGKATTGCITGAMTAIRSGNINQIQAAYAGTKSIDEALTQAATGAKAAIRQYKAQVGN